MLICKKNRSSINAQAIAMTWRHEIYAYILACNAVLICDPSRLNGNYTFLQKPNT